MKLIRRFFKEEEGIATIEIVLILVVLIALVVIFKGSISTLLQNIMNKITNGANDVMK